MSIDTLTIRSLRPGSGTSAVYWTVRSSAMGMLRSEIDQRLHQLPDKVIENALFRLKASGLIAQPLGRGTCWLVDESCGALPDDVDVLAAVGTVLLDLVVDCDAGISVRMLAGEVGLCDAEVHAALLPALAGGQVERFELEPHRGGMAYRPAQHLLAQIAAAERVRLVALGMADDDVVVLDVPSVPAAALPAQTEAAS